MTQTIKPFTLLNTERDAEVCGPDGCLIPAGGPGRTDQVVQQDQAAAAPRTESE